MPCAASSSTVSSDWALRAQLLETTARPRRDASVDWGPKVVRVTRFRRSFSVFVSL